MLRALALIALFSLPLTARADDAADLVRHAKRIVCLGDSITHAGGWVTPLSIWLEREGVEADVINMGLPSETVSGLSEDGHADGKSPRPDLAERLDRVLRVSRPDLVIACYGMNCGIYQPLDEQREIGRAHV